MGWEGESGGGEKRGGGQGGGESEERELRRAAMTSELQGTVFMCAGRKATRPHYHKGPITVSV